MSNTIRYEFNSAIATITIARPEIRNALGPEEWRGLHEAVRTAGDDESVRVVVLRGAGGTFCSGGDLQTLPERLALPVSTRRNRLVRESRVIRDLRALQKPVVAVIEGHCLGAGLSLALACDLRIAASLARFAASFHRIGLTADFGASYLLPDAVGVSKALELLLMAEVIDAAEALRIGLVHRVYPAEEFPGRSHDLVAGLAQLPTQAVAATKLSVYRSARMGLAAALEYEAAGQAIMGKTEDVAEGVKAFQEKRAPRFQGR
jgi:2-(1,2-epoxy-1,2-dihydrophenyl)acetyl-CoA isomerase